MEKIKNWLSNQGYSYMRVWRIMKKPTIEEIKLISKVSAVGILIVGFIGFLIQILMILIKTKF